MLTGSAEIVGACDNACEVDASSNLRLRSTQLLAVIEAARPMMRPALAVQQC